MLPLSPWPAVQSVLWALSVLLTLLAMSAAWSGPVAKAATQSFTPAFSPSQFLGEGSILDAQFTFMGTEYHGSPDPVTEVIVHLPAGVGGSSAGFPTCSELTLETAGPAGCPAGSLAGPLGSIGLDIEEGSSQSGTKRVHSTGTIQPVFANPEEAGSDALFFYAEAPGFQYLVRAWYLEDTPPYGRELRLEFPLIEDVPGQPFASITSLTLTLGASREEDGQPVSSLTIPQECPASGMFPWAADVTYTPNATFTEQTHAHTTAETTCPASSGKLTTTTTLQVSTASPHVGEVVSYTATVTPKTLGTSQPSGSVTFLDEGKPILGCAAQALVLGAASSTANCQLSYPASGTHHVSARYGGDASYFDSESTAQVVMVSAIEPPREAPAEPKPSLVVSCCDGPAQPPLISLAQLKALLVSQLTPSGKAAKIGALLRSGGYTATFQAPEAGTVTVSWYQVPSGAKLARKAKPILVATGKLALSGAGTSQLKIKLTSAGKRLLKHAKRLKLEAEGVFVPRGGVAVSDTKQLVLGR